MNDDILPTYDGAKNKSISRKLLEQVGGPNSIRKSYVTSGDGAVTMCHTKGAGCAPQLTTSMPITNAPKQTNMMWGWPWHGVFRNTDTGGLVTPFTGGLDNPLRGYNPSELPNRRLNFNSITIVPAGQKAQPIPAPVGATDEQRWVNYITLSEGVLFGEQVGQDVWVTTINKKGYVVKLTSLSTDYINLTFFTIDAWVASMPEAAAGNFVKNDNTTKNPFMSSVLPTGAALVSYQSADAWLPQYPGLNRTENVLRLKRTALSQDGSKFVLAFEMSGKKDGYTWTADGANLARTNRVSVEVLWVEIVISSDASGLITLSQSTLGGHQTGVLGETDYYQLTGAGTSGSELHTRSGSRTVTCGYMYTPLGVAMPVTVTTESNIRVEKTGLATLSEVGNLLGYNSACLGDVHTSASVSFNGATMTLSRRAVYDFSHYYPEGASALLHGNKLGNLTFMINGDVRYFGGVGTSNERFLAGGYGDIKSYEAVPSTRGYLSRVPTTTYPYYADVPYTHTGTTNLVYATPAMGLRRAYDACVYSRITSIGGDPAPEAYLPTDATYNMRGYFFDDLQASATSLVIQGWPDQNIQTDSQWPSVGHVDSLITIFRDGYNSFSVCAEQGVSSRTPEDEDYLLHGIYYERFEPLGHLTPYGWLIPAIPPTHAEAIGGWGYSLGELAILVQSGEIVFDANGRCVTDKVIKYAKQDGAKHNPRRCI